MEVSSYKVTPSCYPRFYNTRERLKDIFKRFYTLWFTIFGYAYTNTKSNAKTECDVDKDNVQCFVCKRTGEADILTHVMDIVLQNDLITNHGPVSFENFEKFWHQMQDSFCSTTIIILNDYPGLVEAIKKVRSKANIVIIANTQSIETYKMCPYVTISSKDTVARDICLILERLTFKPMKDKFHQLKQMLEVSRNIDQNMEISTTQRRVSVPVQDKASSSQPITTKENGGPVSSISTTYQPMEKQVKCGVCASNSDLETRQTQQDGDQWLNYQVIQDNGRDRTDVITSTHKQNALYDRLTRSKSKITNETSRNGQYQDTRQKQRDGDHSLLSTTYQETNRYTTRLKLSLTHKNKIVVEGDDLTRSKSKTINENPRNGHKDQEYSEPLISATGDTRQSTKNRKRKIPDSGNSKKREKNTTNNAMKAEFGRLTRSKAQIMNENARNGQTDQDGEEELPSQSRVSVPEIQAKDGIKRKINDNRETIQRLLGEMTSMYRRSKVPVEEQPSLDDTPKKEVSGQLLDALFAISRSIKGCGYRFYTLQIFVSKCDITENLSKKISTTLMKHDISDFAIVPSLDDVIHYKHFYVGAKVLTNQGYASLGGFAKVKKKNGHNGDVLCALISKHAASENETVTLVRGTERMQARIIPETVPDAITASLDISAAWIRKQDEKRCETKFKTENGTFMRGKECSYDNEQLDCLPVHIAGASTTRGLGIITMPNIQDRDRDERSEQDGTYIVVEDREGSSPFCVEGDSGSMVCADDEDGEGVHLISTVIGKSMGGTGNYCSLRLKNALDQLKEQTNQEFTFCG